MQAPLAVPPGIPGEAELKLNLSRALLHFQDRLLEGNITPGSLCQVWMPGMSEEGDQVLKAKGQPYCAAGVVDLLALFRCISCRYCFSTDLTKPELLGAPGRVFTSRQPEMTRNVQHQSKDVYLRAQEAMHCRVHSTLVLPLYRSPERESVAGVLEVIQTSEDMVFAQLVDILSEELERCNLYTVDDIQRAQLHKKAPELLATSASTSKAEHSTHVSTSRNGSSNGSPKSIHNETGLPEGAGENSSQLPSTLFQRLPEMGDSSIRGGVAAGGVSPFIKAHTMVPQPEMGMQMRGSSDAAAALQLAKAPSLGMVTRHSGQLQAARPFVPVKSMEHEDSKTSSYFDEEEIGSEDMDGWDDDLEDSAEGVGDEASRAASRRRGKGTGNPGKPGKKLRLADLQSQFGVGLKEAANKLGICPTTLKRACRRHGIQRWPRRQLARLTRAIDQIRSSGGNGVPVVERPLRSSSRGKAFSDEPVLLTSPTGSIESLPSASGGLCQSEPGPDTRWTALDQLVPNFDHNNPDSVAVPENVPITASLPASVQPGQQPLAVSPSLLPHHGQDSPNPPLSFSPALITGEPQTDTDFGTQLSMPSLAADAWAVTLKDDPWAESAKAASHADPSNFTHSMQVDGNDSCMSLGDTIACGRAYEEESVHGANVFERHMSSRSSRANFAAHGSGLPPLHDSPASQLAASDLFGQGGLSIPLTTGLRSSAHGMAASHIPALDEGLLAQSLQSAMPQGLCRLPQSLPTMLSAAYSQANLRHSLAMQLRQGQIAHSMSLSNLHHEMLMLREHRIQQEMPGRLTAHLTANNAFGMLHKDEQSQLCEANGLQNFSTDDAVMNDGLDGDMLEMLLPEDS